jgi:hypothetical protein
MKISTGGLEGLTFDEQQYLLEMRRANATLLQVANKIKELSRQRGMARTLEEMRTLDEAAYFGLLRVAEKHMINARD